MSSNPAHGEEYSIQQYVIKFVSDLRKSDFLRVLLFPPLSATRGRTEQLCVSALGTITSTHALFF